MFNLALGDFHPALVHFPIVLVFLAFVSDLLYLGRKNALFHTMSGYLIIAAAVFILPTAITGFGAKEFYSQGDPDVQRHQNMALLTATYTIGYAIFRAYAIYGHKVFSLYVYLVLSLVNAGLINTTAEFGGIVVRGKGILSDSLRPNGAPLPYGHVREGQ